MNITTKMIITDTNIISDLSNANVLKEFVNLDNVFISDLIKNDEVNSKTGNLEIINDFKVISCSETQLVESINLSEIERKLSKYDIINFIIARDNSCILATGDNNLKIFAEKSNIEVIRTLKIIELLVKDKIITPKKGINACDLLEKCSSTRIPIRDINNIKDKIKKEYFYSPNNL